MKKEKIKENDKSQNYKIGTSHVFIILHRNFLFFFLNHQYLIYSFSVDINNFKPKPVPFKLMPQSRCFSNMTHHKSSQCVIGGCVFIGKLVKFKLLFKFLD